MKVIVEPIRVHREVILHPVYAQKVYSLKIANADERFRILAKKSCLFIRSLIQIFHYLRKRIKRIKRKKLVGFARRMSIALKEFLRVDKLR